MTLTEWLIAKSFEEVRQASKIFKSRFWFTQECIEILKNMLSDDFVQFFLDLYGLVTATKVPQVESKSKIENYTCDRNQQDQQQIPKRL